MSSFRYVQLNLGRNVGNVPMSEERWGDFQLDAARLIGDLEHELNGWAVDTPRTPFEVHEGVGVYDGIVEESAHVSILIEVSSSVQLTGPQVASAFTAFQRAVRELAGRYGQDSIAMITGSKLIKVSSKD